MQLQFDRDFDIMGCSSPT